MTYTEWVRRWSIIDILVRAHLGGRRFTQLNHIAECERCLSSLAKAVRADWRKRVTEHTI